MSTEEDHIAGQLTFNLYQDKPLSDKVTESENIIREYYLKDPRPFVLAYSAGKDSNVIIKGR